MSSNHPTNPGDVHPVDLHPAEPGDVEAEAVRPLKRQRCQQCQALVMPAALNELLRCLSCTGQLDLFPLHDPAIVKRGRR